VPVVMVEANREVRVDPTSRLPSNSNTRYSVVAGPNWSINDRTGLITGTLGKNSPAAYLTAYASGKKYVNAYFLFARLHVRADTMLTH
jgi:hypothetical protein